tara:strand:- start:84 stop:635 length:552 start_codon:yes stop_codon:yes gene_type:complete
MNANLNNMKTKKTINILFYLFIYLNGINIYSQENKRFLVSKERISSFSINGLKLKDLNDPGRRFEKLEKLGKPLNIKYSKSFLEKIWIYEYYGFKLTFVNVNGYPELLEMNINNLNTEFKICLDKKRLNEKELLNDMKKSKGKFIEGKRKNSEKFDGSSSFLEINLTDNYKRIKFILYKNKII